MSDKEGIVEWKLVFVFLLCLISIIGLLCASDMLEPILWFILVAIISAIH